MKLGLLIRHVDTLPKAAMSAATPPLPSQLDVDHHDLEEVKRWLMEYLTVLRVQAKPIARIGERAVIKAVKRSARDLCHNTGGLRVNPHAKVHSGDAAVPRHGVESPMTSSSLPSRQPSADIDMARQLKGPWAGDFPVSFLPGSILGSICSKSKLAWIKPKLLEAHAPSATGLGATSQLEAGSKRRLSTAAMSSMDPKQKGIQYFPKVPCRTPRPGSWAQRK
ncbi:hypothetical protein EDB84DRAFT_1444641 [Lactarius hengduanensis]|nr:hypothetical protein EDB84DRAFT_1444641 [Lactarius hengduanensis]